MKKRWPTLSAIHTIAFDFDGVFTDNMVYVDQSGVESVRCSRADGLGIDMLRAARTRGLLRADVFILSKESNPVTAARAKKLQLTCHPACDDKLAFVAGYFQKTRTGDDDPFAGLVYAGNDLNDLPMMARAGFSVAPSDAHERVREAAAAVLTERGGEGFVRAFVERLLDVQNMTTEELYELVHHR